MVAILCQHVVAGIIDATEGPARTLIARFGMVVDYVEDHFDALSIKMLACVLHLPHLTRAQIGGMGNEEGEGVVAHIMRESPLHRMPVLHETLHRQKLKFGDAQVRQRVDDRRGALGPKRATILGWHRRMQDGQPAQMGLVDHDLFPRTVEAPLGLPTEIGICDNGFRHKGRGILRIWMHISLSEIMAETRVMQV